MLISSLCTCVFFIRQTWVIFLMQSSSPWKHIFTNCKVVITMRRVQDADVPFYIKFPQDFWNSASAKLWNECTSVWDFFTPVYLVSKLRNKQNCNILLCKMYCICILHLFINDRNCNYCYFMHWKKNTTNTQPFNLFYSQVQSTVYIVQLAVVVSVTLCFVVRRNYW